MATTNSNFKVKNGLDAGGTITAVTAFESSNSSTYFRAPFIRGWNDAASTIQLPGSQNIHLLGGTTSFGGGVKVIGIANTTTAPTTSPTGGGILFVETGALKYRGTSGSSATIVNADGTTSGGSFTGGTLTSGLTLAAGTNAPLRPLTFTQNASTPTAVSGGMDYDGTVFYQTPSATSGRAIDVDAYYYNNTSQFILDYSLSANAQSVLGGTTAGLTVAVGTTYEYELYLRFSGSWGLSGSQTPSFGLTMTTLPLSPVMSFNHFVDTGSNTTSHVTATTLTTTGTTATRTLTTLSAGNVYYFVKAKGFFRITGTGTGRVYPSISMNATNADNTWIFPTGGVIFKATPIGNGTVSTIGIA